MRLGLLFTMRDIYINFNMDPLTKSSSRCRSTSFKDILTQNLSQMTTKTVSIQTKTIIGCIMKRDISFWVWRETTSLRQYHDQSFKMERKLWQKKIILGSEGRKKFKRAGLWESRIWAGKLTIWIRLFHNVFSSIRIG